MTPRELDAQIAEKVIGLKIVKGEGWIDLHYYSDQIESFRTAALSQEWYEESIHLRHYIFFFDYVINAMYEKGWGCDIEIYQTDENKRSNRVSFMRNDNLNTKSLVFDEDLGTAVSMAALEAIEYEV